MNAAQAQERLLWFRRQYGIEPTIGARVSITEPCREQGKAGIITGYQGPHVMVKLDGERHAHPWHPKALAYGAEPTTRSAPTEGEQR